MNRIKNLVIGSGPASIATVKALQDIGQAVEVIDVAYDLEEDIKHQVNVLSESKSDAWTQKEKDKLFPPPIASHKGLERRYLFGSDFPYRIPKQLTITTENCKAEFSHGFGGLGNVWGAAILPYSERQLRKWPISLNELAPSYQNVLRYMPISAEIDNLHVKYPLFTNNPTAIKRNALTGFLLQKMTAIENTLRRKGIEFGRSRLAVDASTGEHGCKYCGHCFDGCPYKSIFNPKYLFEELQRSGLAIHQGFFVQEVHETKEGVEVIAVDINNGQINRFTARRVFLAAGQFATTTILARSLNLLNTPLKIQNSQHFFFPIFLYKGCHYEVDFTLTEIFMEIENPSISPEQIHLQFYGRSQIIDEQLTSLLPSFLPKQIALDHLCIIQGFISSEDSDALELTLASKHPDSSRVEIRGIKNTRTRKIAQETQSLIRRSLIKLGVVPPHFLTVQPPGKSFHQGGSFPMGGSHNIFHSDLLGRPTHFKKVHIVDSANFPNIPGSTITYTIMANADRIVRSIKFHSQ
ncbi:GMC family oxidoreductase N-terminal domain-containing protein [Microbulbifer variabilis]|uniref:GMC family oxidoreductase N-terminal domain-containing protein n=1 Tax=Microbulbifer variabilis TaxID=266805 RepID=UPI001CFC5F3D|nr:GMC family oxidoreductase N-terminal domain-containing protein [Microbulbifer variabilis]